jgi:hypothetical protein
MLNYANMKLIIAKLSSIIYIYFLLSFIFLIINKVYVLISAHYLNLIDYKPRFAGGQNFTRIRTHY